jgi:tRNA modification GTPase
MYVEDTIVAPATAAGNGAVAIVRLSGPKAREILDAIWRPLRGNAPMESRRLYLGDIIDPESRSHLDRAMAVFFPAPKSLTGEDVAELHCHGGSFLVRRVCGLAMRLGVRMAEPGEFTRRAFLNGRIDLTEAEAIADLVEARSDSALRQALEQLGGALAQKLNRLRRELIAIRAHLEVEIDFSDEGLKLPSRGDIAASIERFLHDVALLHDSYQRGRLTREGIRVAIIGRPNVGKSSILNLLLGRERAIVSAIPGTTRDVIEDTIQVGQYSLVLLDTAGIRESSDEVERLGIERSHRSLLDCDVALVVFDAAQTLTEDDVAIAHRVHGRVAIALLNKSDLPIRVTVAGLREMGVDAPVLAFSALRAEGVESLKVELIRIIESLTGSPTGEHIAISRERHREALARALDALSAARRSALDSMPPEIIAVDVMLAADALGQITGQVHTEDVLDAVFREFCIGK